MLLFIDSIFKSKVYFIDVVFDLSCFIRCTFEGMALFRKSKSSKDGDLKNENIDENILADTKYANLTIFGDVRFLSKSSKIENFPLSKTSFLKTDMSKIMLFCDFKKEKILSHKFLTGDYDKNKEAYNRAHKILKNLLNHKTVITEYKNLRMSFEDNKAHKIASKLYLMEMELKKEYSKSGFERGAIELYGVISNYGESVHRPIIFMIMLVLITPFALIFADWANSFINSIIQHIPISNYSYGFTYANYLNAILRAEFYNEGKKTILKTIVYCIDGILSLILMSNLYISIKKKLSRRKKGNSLYQVWK